MNINAFVEKGGSNSYSCCADQVISNCLLVGYGSTAQEAVEDFWRSYDELKQSDGDKVPAIDVNLSYDIGSLFNLFKFLNIEGMAKASGINASVLRQYASGVRTPKEKSLRALESALQRAAEEISRVKLRT